MKKYDCIIIGAVISGINAYKFIIGKDNIKGKS